MKIILSVLMFLLLFAGYLIFVIFLSPSSIIRKRLAEKNYLKIKGNKIKTKKSGFRTTTYTSVKATKRFYNRKIIKVYYNYEVNNRVYTKVLDFIHPGIDIPNSIELYYSPKNPKRTYSTWDAIHLRKTKIKFGCFIFFMIWAIILAGILFIL